MIEFASHLKGKCPYSDASYESFGVDGLNLAPVEGICYSILASLLPWMEIMKKSIANFKIHEGFHRVMLGFSFSHLCCVLQAMAVTTKSSLSEELLFKWYDLVQDSARLGFDMTSLLDHIEHLARVFVEFQMANVQSLTEKLKIDGQIATAHSAKEALKKEMTRLDEKIAELETRKDAMVEIDGGDVNVGFHL